MESSRSRRLSSLEDLVLKGGETVRRAWLAGVGALASKWPSVDDEKARPRFARAKRVGVRDKKCARWMAAPPPPPLWCLGGPLVINRHPPPGHDRRNPWAERGERTDQMVGPDRIVQRPGVREPCEVD